MTLLSIAFFYLFGQPFAQLFDIWNVLNVTQITTFATISHGPATATRIKYIDAIRQDEDDSATEAQVNRLIGNHHTMVREDFAMQ